MTLCFATNNAHKLSEVSAAVKSLKIVSLSDIQCHEALPETSETLEGNALQKAEYVYTNYQSPCFADDTGLEVEALNGAPGVYSARYAGEHRSDEDNMALLLQNLKPFENRKARFRTIISLIGLTPQPVFFEGIVHGKIIHEKRGNAGFGYDPIFVPEGHSSTFAEMSLEEKNNLSHRALAVNKLVHYLKKLEYPTPNK